jgi:hypothetical protein
LVDATEVDLYSYRAETYRSINIKCDFNNILGNLNVIAMTFKNKSLYYIRDGMSDVSTQQDAEI